MATDESPAEHPDVRELTAYLDGALAGADRSRVTAHLAGCGECRAEVTAVAGLIRTAPRWRLAVPAGLAAAAVLVMLLVPSLNLLTRSGPARTREAAVTTTVQPVAIAPRGDVDSVSALVWSTVPRATRYRAILLDAGGTVVWRTETTDTAAVVPDSASPRAGASYFWKVEAETGFDRWVASDLVDFRSRAPRR